MRILLTGLVALIVSTSTVRSQSVSSAAGETTPSPRFDWGYQATLITQTAPSFRDPYSGPRSFANEGSARPLSTLTATLFTGLRLWRGAWISVQPEFAGGTGVGGGQGLAGYVNQDAVKAAGSVKQTPYVARAFIHQDIPLGSAAAQLEFASDDGSRDLDAFVADSNSHFEAGARQRLEITLGKFALPDFLDSNEVAGDVHHRLMNWALVNNGSWDYAADARGYTWGLVVGLFEGPFSFRLALAAVPSEANGIRFDRTVSKAHSANAELSWDFDSENKGTIRLMGWQNSARMGSYQDALRGGNPPDITASRQPGRTKTGVGLNLQRSFDSWGTFLRAGWSDGRTESFAYTEIDRTLSLGLSRTAEVLGRPRDTIVAGFVMNGLSSLHRRYLEAGGIGFQLGDGRLRYGSERALEVNYNGQITRKVSLAADLQCVWNPGYNRDRGPVSVYGVRVHIHT